MHLSVATILAESARRFPNKTALIEGDDSVTYGGLWEQARGVAAALVERGLQPGDLVGLLGSNSLDFVRAYYGILAAGAAVLPLPTLLIASEITPLLERSRAASLVCTADQANLAAEAAATASIPVWAMGATASTGLPETANDGSPARSAPRPLGEQTATPSASFANRPADSTAVVFFTSGTTGIPKGAMLTHLNLVMNATVNAFDNHPFHREDIVLGCLPLFHTFGQSVALNATFRIGATLVLQPRFSAIEALSLMKRHGVTAFFGVPTMYVQLLSASGAYDGLRMCVSGGAALPVSVLERFEQNFGVKIYEGYGLSETSPTAAVNQPAFGTRPGTVGHSIWGVEVEVADPDVEDAVILMPTGERGEVVVKGHNVFAGYLEDQAATDAVMYDGWFRTGDIGLKDDDGFLSIVDRKKDLIVRSGFNVYPREVEETLSQHPAVEHAAVIGVSDQERGEEIVAVLQARPGHTIEPDELLNWAKQRLGRHKYPRTIHVVEQMPVSASHKILKRLLRDDYLGESQDGSPSVNQ